MELRHEYRILRERLYTRVIVLVRNYDSSGTDGRTERTLLEKDVTLLIMHKELQREEDTKKVKGRQGTYAVFSPLREE